VNVEKRNAYSVLGRHPEGTGPRHKWQNNDKIYMKVTQTY
jgi:hypothetical protein